MVESVGSEHMGKIAGLTSTLTAAGTCAGPVLAGFLFGLGGYWPSWLGPAVFLVVDILMRVLLINRPKAPQESKCGKYTDRERERERERERGGGEKKLSLITLWLASTKI